MELQCKERVDLLEALRQSRLESEGGKDSEQPSSGATNGKVSKSTSAPQRQASDTHSSQPGYLGGGTIPAVSLPDIPRPGPPLPKRPPIVPKNSSERAVVGSRNNLSSSNTLPTMPTLTSRPSTSPSLNLAPNPSLAPNPKKTSRSPSPDKGRSMLTTLRKNERKPTPRLPSTTTSERPVPSKAATLAWNSIVRNGNDGIGRSLAGHPGGSSTSLEAQRKGSLDRPRSLHEDVHYDSHTRRLVNGQQSSARSPIDLLTGADDLYSIGGKRNNSYPFPSSESTPTLNTQQQRKPSHMQELIDIEPPTPLEDNDRTKPRSKKEGRPPPPPPPTTSLNFQPVSYPTYFREYSGVPKKTDAELPLRRRSPVAPDSGGGSSSTPKVPRKPVANVSSPRQPEKRPGTGESRRSQRRDGRDSPDSYSSPSIDEDALDKGARTTKPKKKAVKHKETGILADDADYDDSGTEAQKAEKNAWDKKVEQLMQNLPKGVDESAAKQIFNEIVVHGDEVHWEDVAGLEVAKGALKEAVVYPFLRPDLFMGLREPARGMLLFGPPGTGKTMLARAVATESKSTFFSISASSLTSKYLGESEKLVRALFGLAKALAPSIIFVDEIDSLLSTRSGSGEHEATRRIKTEFLIQWSDLQRAAAGREQTEKEKERGDASRVLVLAATNLPWAIDEAARRRFVRRQYIPLPEPETRAAQLKRLLGHQKHNLDERDIQRLVQLTDGMHPLAQPYLLPAYTDMKTGFSGSDITALAKDAAMGPLRSLGEALLHMSMDDIRPIEFADFRQSLVNIRPSVSKQGLKEFEDWARDYGERGG
jgi:SpoVK/Ycf46/Vps4 family AAA+-type ATPase